MMKRHRIFQRHHAVVLWWAVSLLTFHLPVLAQNTTTDRTAPADSVALLYGDSPCDTCPAMSGQLRIATIPSNQNLTGTVTENTEYRSPEIVSSQVIASGSVVYTAGEITLGPGFEVKAGAQFETHTTDTFLRIPILTYNLHGNNTDYEAHARYIKQFHAAVVAVQEVYREANFTKLKDATGLSGYMCTTIDILIKYGIGLLWNPTLVGNPIQKQLIVMETPKEKEITDNGDKKRGFIVAEFQLFCFVSTHLSLHAEHRMEMTTAILNNTIVQDCLSKDKPVYVAGDMNEHPGEGSMLVFENNGFTVLNDTAQSHGTGPYGGHCDLILEHNVKPNHRLIDHGIPLSEAEKSTWKDNVSDHFPYRVTVKIR